MAAKTTGSSKTTTKKKTQSTGSRSTGGTKKQSTANKPSAQTSAKSSPKPAAKSETELLREKESRRFWSYILFFFGLLELMITFIPGDGLWKKMFDFNRGMFGVAVFLFAPMIVYVSLMIASNTTKNTVVAKVCEGSVLMLLASGICQILMVGKVEGGSFTKKLLGLYADGKKLHGGGLASSVLGWPLLAAFRKVGASIIILLMAFTFIMLLTDITLPQLLKGLALPFSSGYKAMRDDRIEKVAQRAAAPDTEPEKKAPKPRVETVSTGQERIDIAKYFPDDEPETAAEVYKKQEHSEEETEPDFSELAKMPEHPVKSKRVSQERLKQEAETTDDMELRRIIEDAIGAPPHDETEKKPAVKKRPAQTKAPQEPRKPETVSIEPSGQTTFFEKDNKISAYVYPPVDILKYPKNNIEKSIIEQEIREKSTRLVETLETYGVKTKITGIFRGPTVTRYELQPAAGVKVAKILNLSDDIALNLAAQSIRIEAPVPGKPCVGIEVPNDHRDTVSLRELIDSEDYRKNKGKLTFAVGKDIEGKIVMADIAKMPHLLVAGTTGSGKSVFTSSIILSILYHASPNEVKLILIDPKKVEFRPFSGIPHLLIPVVTDPLKAAGALGWAVNEMNKRYLQFEANGVKNLEEFNKMLSAEHEKPIDQQDPVLATIDPMPQILIVIDEFADLMMAAGSEVEDSVIRLGQLARASGIHMIIATQSPRRDVITGLIKSNIPSRVALSVASYVESSIIIDQKGAEKLLDKGDLLFKPVWMKTPARIQCGFASTPEIKAVVDFLQNEHSTEYSEEIMAEVEENMPKPKEDKKDKSDDPYEPDTLVIDPDAELIDQAIAIFVQTGEASTSYLQRKLKLGFGRASRIMDELEDMGIIGPKNGSNPRTVNITKEEWLERQARS